tara:strand:- start:337 stop:474 length:138 start_codon:yes stop_codon:yes gene_type:complete
MENGFFIIKGGRENDSMRKNHEIIEYYKLIINIYNILAWKKITKP